MLAFWIWEEGLELASGGLVDRWAEACIHLVHIH